MVSLDFETTGLAPEAGDRITEVGLVRIEEGRIVERFSSLMNCDVRVPRSITAYTGITQAMVDDAPSPLEVMTQVLAFIDGCSVVSHNALFDQQFLQAECLRLGLIVPAEPFICSMRIARRLYPHVHSPSLANLARVLALPMIGAPHRAPADAETTAQLAMHMMRNLEVLQPAEGNAPSLLSRLRYWSSSESAAVR
jgi:DNA polymerase III subunit epsilon